MSGRSPRTGHLLHVVVFELAFDQVDDFIVQIVGRLLGHFFCEEDQDACPGVRGCFFKQPNNEIAVAHF